MSIIAYKTKAEWAYQYLRERIHSGDLKANERLDQDMLARELNISRVPLRQALAQLKADELVVGRPHSSMSVAPLSLEQAEDIYASRCVLEPMLTAVAVSQLDETIVAKLREIIEAQKVALEVADRIHLLRLDRGFHSLLYEQSGYRISINTVERLREMSDRYVATFQKTTEGSEKTVAEHCEIVRACALRDTKCASRLVRAHVIGGIEFVRTLFVMQPRPEMSASASFGKEESRTKENKSQFS